MRKTTMAIGLGLALAMGTIGAAGSASAQSTDAKPRQGAVDGRRGGRGGPGGMLLKGITLSDAQKARLQELRKQERADDGSRDKFREAMQAAREARQRGDTAAANARMRELRGQMEQQRERQVAALRTILTPDQQKQLDSNLAELKQRQGERPHRGFGEGHGRHGDRNGR